MHKIQECKRCEAFDLDEKVVQAGNVVVLDEKNPHIRNLRDGTIIKMGREQRRVHDGHVGAS